MLLGREIRIQRVIKGYSQEYVANRLDISQNAYSKIERGDTELSVRRMFQIADILEVPVTVLLPEAKASSSISFSGVNLLLTKIRLLSYRLFK